MSTNVERLSKAGLIDPASLTEEQAKSVEMLTPDEVAALISVACTLGFEKSADSPYVNIL